MRKRSLCIILVISILIIYYPRGVINADVTNDMLDAYEEIISIRPDWGAPIEAFSESVWNEYNILVVSRAGSYPENLATLKESDGSPNDYNNIVKEYRYIGTTPDGYLVNNPKYPDDHSGESNINNYVWQPNLEEVTKITQYISNEADQLFYEEEIFHFLEAEYGSRFDESEDPQKWLDNAIVIVPVSSTGNGVIKYVHKWDKHGDGYAEEWYLTVNLRSKNEANFERKLPGKISDDSYSTEVDVAASNVNSLIDLRSGSKENEEFNSELAIPSGEDLYISAQVDEYIAEYGYVRYFGSNDYNVFVSKNYYLRRWDSTAIMIDANGDGDYLDPGDSISGDWVLDGPHQVRGSYTVHRGFEYYEINSLDVYRLDSISVNNDCLPGTRIDMNSSVEAPHVEYIVNGADNFVAPSSQETHYLRLADETIGDDDYFPSVPGPNFRSDAERLIGAFRVRNDSLVINGQIVMDGTWRDSVTTAPLNVVSAPLNPVGDLYQENITIPDSTPNGLYSTTGSVSYEQIYPIGDSGTITQPLNGFEDVYVHTPVVCYPELDNISRETQLVDKDSNDLQLVIEETMHIDYPTSGQHMNATGYGERDYQEYIEVKQVRFPMDVYVGTGYDGLYLPKGTWGNFNSLENEFFIPSWAEEGDGHILFRTLAINIADYDAAEYEYNANMNSANYKAVEAIGINITGKINNLTITNCPDDYWKNNFDNGDQMYIGTTPDNKSEISGQGVTISDDNILPLLPGKTYVDENNDSNTYGGVMLGYPVDFSLTTNGDLYDATDLIYITPSFSYVPSIAGVPDMSMRQDVDLYISTYQGIESFETDLVLTSDDRTNAGNLSDKPGSISNNNKERSVQQWNGRYFLPNMTYALPAGTGINALGKLDVHSDPFLHDGFIIVNFEIDVYDDVTGLTKSMLSDIEALRNHLATQSEHIIYGVGWQEEGYDTNQLGIDLREGDIMFYSTEHRASETYY